MKALFARQLLIASRTPGLAAACCLQAGVLGAFALIWRQGVPALPGDNLYEQQRLLQWSLLSVLLPWAASRCLPASAARDLAFTAAVAATSPARAAASGTLAIFGVLHRDRLDRPGASRVDAADLRNTSWSGARRLAPPRGRRGGRRHVLVRRCSSGRGTAVHVDRGKHADGVHFLVDGPASRRGSAGRCGRHSCRVRRDAAIRRIVVVSARGTVVTEKPRFSVNCASAAGDCGRSRSASTSSWQSPSASCLRLEQSSLRGSRKTSRCSFQAPRSR